MFKKKLGFLILAILIFCTFFLGIIAIYAPNIFALARQNSDFYYSEKNAPVIYGTSKIKMSKNAVTNFNVQDARFRVFARDFEDGELAVKCISNNVQSNTAGEYTIVYSVTDSHNNTSTLTVPVTVTNDENKLINVERILYMLPNDWNFEFVGMNRCNKGDRQHLGIYLPAGKSFKFRVLKGGRNTVIDLLNNDRLQERGLTVKYNTANDNYTTVQNTVSNQPASSYDSIPLVTSIILGRGGDISTTYKIEMEYNADDVHPLNYYRYGDDEAAFRQTWLDSRDGFAIIENEAVTMLTPVINIRAAEQGIFKTYDKVLEYYLKVVRKMDDIVGLSFHPDKAVHQNFRSKYLIRANKNGWGFAYYNGNHVGANSASMDYFFTTGWAEIHEVGHGYQGYLGKGTMQLGEVGNNILAHYTQMDKSIYPASSDWLEKDKEDARNSGRLSGKTFLQINVKERLYAIVNLFDSFEGPNTYAKMFRYFREKMLTGEFTSSTPNQDIYALFFADEYNVNILPYWDAWRLNVSDAVVKRMENVSQSASILADNAGTKLNEIMQGENLTRKYLVVKDSILEKYNVQSNLTINIQIDNPANIEGKLFFLEQGNNTKYKANVQGGQVVFNNIYTGTYYLRSPILEKYIREVKFSTLKQGDNSYNIVYSSIDTTGYHPTMLGITGIHNTYGFQLQLAKQNTSGTVILGAANLGNQSNGWANAPNDLFISVKILDNNKNQIYLKEVKGNGYFTTSTVPNETITLDYGYVVEIFTHNPKRVKIYSMITKQELPAANYTGLNTNNGVTISYTITKDGFVPSFKDDSFSAADAAYTALRPILIDELNQYVEYFNQNPNKLESKYLNEQDKSLFLTKFYTLREEDKAPYIELMQKIVAGGKPNIEVLYNNIEVDQYKDLDFINYIKVFDNEDKEIVLTADNFKVESNWDFRSAGRYNVALSVADSDGNISTCEISIRVLRGPTILDKEQQKTINLFVIGGALLLATILWVMIATITKVNAKKKRESK